MPITAPYRGFCEGVERTCYSFIEEGDRLMLAFEPWFVDAAQGRDVPCLRLVFQREGDRVVLERFTICDRREERLVDLDAAHDALQAWLDYLSS